LNGVLQSIIWGTFFLTLALVDTLERGFEFTGVPSRVVNVASVAHFTAGAVLSFEAEANPSENLKEQMSSLRWSFNEDLERKKEFGKMRSMLHF